MALVLRGIILKRRALLWWGTGLLGAVVLAFLAAVLLVLRAMESP